MFKKIPFITIYNRESYCLLKSLLRLSSYEFDEIAEAIFYNRQDWNRPSCMTSCITPEEYTLLVRVYGKWFVDLAKPLWNPEGLSGKISNASCRFVFLDTLPFLVPEELERIKEFRGNKYLRVFDRNDTVELSRFDPYDSRYVCLDKVLVTTKVQICVRAKAMIGATLLNPLVKDVYAHLIFIEENPLFYYMRHITNQCSRDF